MGAQSGRVLSACPRCEGGSAACTEEGEDVEEADMSSDPQGREDAAPFKSYPSGHRPGKEEPESRLRPRPLRSHFLSQAYAQGYDMSTANTDYTFDQGDGGHEPSYWHQTTGIRVSCQALHLAPYGTPDLDLLFYYTTETVFGSIGHAVKVTVKQWEALRQEGMLVGRAIYACSREPSEVGTKKVLTSIWPEQARYCLVIVLPKAWVQRGAGLRPKSNMLKGLENFEYLDICSIRCPTEAEALKVSSECNVQRFRIVAETCRKEKGSDDPDTLSALSYLAYVLQEQGEYGEAEQNYREALLAYEKLFGDSHPQTLATLNNLAYLLASQEQTEEAEPLFRRALGCYEVQLGPEHPDTLRALSYFAALLVTQGRVEEAEPIFWRTMEGREVNLGPEHPETLQSQNALAELLEAAGRLHEAEALRRRILTWSERSMGEVHPDTLLAVSRLARILQAQGELEVAEPLFRRAAAGSRKHLGESHLSTLMREDSLAAVLRSQGNLEQAKLTYTHVLAGREASLGQQHSETLMAAGMLAEVLEAQGQLEQAEVLYRRVYAGRETKLGMDHPLTLRSAKDLAGVLKAQGKLESDQLFYKKLLLQAHLSMIGVKRPDTVKIVEELACLLGSPGL